MIRSVLMLSPEPPYPLHGGGAYRIASLVHYFARFAAVDLILISESGLPALLPEGLVRTQTVLPLPRHNRGTGARWLRNARRAVMGVPPLIDRLAGLEGALDRAIGGRRYDLGIVEHFWCAPYVSQMEKVCGQMALDLHNVESVLHERCAEVKHDGAATWPARVAVGSGHRRFAAASRRMEAELLPRYGVVLATSESDRVRAVEIAPNAGVEVYPNALPYVPAPRRAPTAGPPTVVFSGNFEYHPNIDAVRFLAAEIWPEVRRSHPQLRLRLVGRGDTFVRSYLGTGMEATGPVDDAWSEIAAADIVIAPLRAGSGTRVKIPEAWSAARPVVATPLAAEGLEYRDGENIALATSPKEFAEVIGRLLRDRDWRDRLAEGGRRTFEEYYTWEAAWRGLDRIFGGPQVSSERDIA